MKFNPAELDAKMSNLWAEGVYKFKVVDANEVSNEYGSQIALDLEVFGNNRSKRLKDWLSPTTKSGDPNLRLMFFCRSVGLLERYKTGELLDGDCVNKIGYLMLSQAKTASGDDINKISRFLTDKEFEDENNKHNNASHVTKLIDDDVPF